MRALAEAMYAVSYLEWALLGDIPRLTAPPADLSIEGLSRSAMGTVAKAVRRAANDAVSPSEVAWLSAAADALEDVVDKRNQVIHAHPATIGGEQMLHRWAAATPSRAHEAFAITEDHLVALRDSAYEHLRRMNEVRLTT